MEGREGNEREGGMDGRRERERSDKVKGVDSTGIRRGTLKGE